MLCDNIIIYLENVKIVIILKLHLKILLLYYIKKYFKRLNRKYKLKMIKIILQIN